MNGSLSTRSIVTREGEQVKRFRHARLRYHLRVIPPNPFPQTYPLLSTSGLVASFRL